MHTTHAKKDKTKVTGKLGTVKTGLVLTPRGGRMQDRRTARNRTRSQQRASALAGW